MFLLAAVNVTKTPMRDHRIAIFGADGAGIGIASLLIRAMIEDGLTPDEARKRSTSLTGTVCFSRA